LPPRQQTMEATISWSFRLLNEAERTLLQRASILAGGFTLEAAEVVCSDAVVSTEDVPGLLTRLVEKSLVNVIDVADKPRYTLLEVIRALSLERLKETTEYTDTARRHAEWIASRGDALHAAWTKRLACVSNSITREPQLHGAWDPARTQTLHSRPVSSAGGAECGARPAVTRPLRRTPSPRCRRSREARRCRSELWPHRAPLEHTLGDVTMEVVTLSSKRRLHSSNAAATLRRSR